jgi:predicted amidohydrolase YtcJ
MLNSRALAAITLDDSRDVERDEAGQPTGRLWRYDTRLREALPRLLPDLTPVAAELASYGLTSVTDATPDLDAAALSDLRDFALPVTPLGDPQGEGPWKVLLRDHDLPTYDELVALIAARRPRPVAVHCVTRVSLLLTLAVLDDVGRMPGDRIEHASVVPDPMSLHGLIVVTQPAFVVLREADYRRDVAPEDLPHLYRHRSLLQVGVDVLPSSDAPYGPVDPWAVMRAARERDLGTGERVDPATVIRGYQRGRRLRPGGSAELTLLHTPLTEALDALDARVVRGTWTGTNATTTSRGCSGPHHVIARARRRPR